MARRIDAYDRVNRQLGFGLRLLGLWLALVGFYFLGQTLAYRGLVADLAEYQFLHFDRYWPTFTFLALTILCTAPFFIILWVIRARQRRSERLGPARIDDQRIMLGRVGRLQNFFAGLAIGCLICVGIIIVQMSTLPSDDYEPRSIVIGSPDALGPADGRAVLTGSVDLSETAQFNEDLILVRRTFYFAPIRSGPKDKSPLKYFVQVRRDDARGKASFNPIVFPEGDDKVRGWRFRVRNIAFTPYMNGVLQRGALPGEIANLYRYAGYDVDRDRYVLFASNEPIRWRLQVLAGEFLIASVLAALVALLFARRRRKIRRIVRAQAEVAGARVPRARG
jgi:hypothetical protein